MKDCELNKDGHCTCYLKKCETIKDCAPKLIIRRNLESVNKLIS
jgi:hypothetical protein